MKRRFLHTTSITTLLFLVVIGITSNPNLVHAQAGAPVFDAGNYIKNTITALFTQKGAISSGVTAANTGVITGTTGATAFGTQALVTKGYVLDPLVSAVSKVALQAVVKSTVTWINSGFKGAPAFATNLQNTLTNTGNAQAATYLQQLSTNGSIKSPFQNTVASAVSSSYNTQTNGGSFAANPYTLNKTTTNDAAFFNGQFTQGGGFNTWLAAFGSTANNPFGATLLATNGLNSSVSNAVKNQQTELSWGQGFLSAKSTCPSSTTAPSSSSASSGGLNLSSLVSLSGASTNCATASVKTPGSTTKASLDKSLGSSIDSLVGSKELGQLVSALLTQLMNQVLGPTGLFGISQPSASNGGTSYFNQQAALAASSTGTAGVAGTTGAASETTAASAAFTQVLANQLQQIEQFEGEWNTIGSAAVSAGNALLASTCYPNAQATVTSTVQPVISQANTEINIASSSIASLVTIQNELPTPADTDPNVIATKTAQASSDYSALQAQLQTSLPPTDVQYAAAQSQDTGTSSPTSLYTQMVQLGQAATTCNVPASTPPTGT